MGQVTREVLKAKWIQGYLPTESDYDEFFDSFFNMLSIEDKATLKTYFDEIYDSKDASSDLMDAHNLAFDHSLITSITDIDKRLSNSLSTGILSGGTLEINTDDTKFDIHEGYGLVVNNVTNGESPTRTFVSWDTFTAVETPYLLTHDNTFIGIDVNGLVITQPDEFTSEQLRDIIVIGWVDHSDRISITQKLTEPNLTSDTNVQVQTFWESLGAFNIKGNVYSANGTNLYINRSEGKTFDNGSNYEVDKRHPNVVETIDEYIIEFQYYYRTSTNTWVNDLPTTTSIDPNNYDSGTGLAPVDTGKYTIQTIFLYAPNVWTDIQYGQKQYDSQELALAGLADLVAQNPYLQWDTRRCYLIVKQGCNDLSISNETVFRDAGKWGQNAVGGGVGSSSGEINTASNIGTLGEGLFEAKVGVDLQFKKVAPETNLVKITNDTNHNVLVGLNTTNMTMFQSSGAYLTTAMQSNQGSNFRVTSADTQLQFTSANSNLLGSGVTTSFRFTSADTQLHFTSANSNFRYTSQNSQLQFTSANSNLQFTSANTKFAGTGTSATNASVTLNSNGLAISVAGTSPESNWINLQGNTSNASTASGSTIMWSAGANITLAASNGSIIKIEGKTNFPYVNTSDAGNVYFNDANGISWGSSVSSLSTSISASFNSTQFAGLGATTASVTGSVLKATLNSVGLNLGVPAWLTTAATGGAGGAAIQGSGTYSQNTGTVQFSNANNVTFGLSNNGVMTASIPVGTVAFGDANGVTFGSSVNGVSTTITASMNAAAGGAAFKGSGTYYQNTGTVEFANSNNFTFGLVAGSMTASFSSVSSNLMPLANSNNYFYTSNNTFANQTHSHGNPTLALTNLTGTTASASNGFTISLSAANPGAGGGVAVAGSAASTVTNGTLQFSNANNVSFGLNGSTMTASIPVGTVAFNDSNGVTFGSSVNGVSTTITASVNAGGGGVAIAGSAASTVTNGTLVFSNANNISFGLNGSTMTASYVESPALSFYQNMDFVGVTQTMNMNSNSWAVFPFRIREGVSQSYMRLLMSAGVGASTTNATFANTSLSAACSQTIFAVLYSQGNGANSRSLQYITSASVGISQSWSMSCDAVNGSNYTLHQAQTFPTEHGTSFTNFAQTIQTTATNISMSQSWSSALTGAKFLDLPFVGQLTERRYWLALGRSITSATNNSVGTRWLSVSHALSFMGVSQPNVAFGLLGQATNATNGSWILNGGLWTTNVQGTTASINLAQVSTSASHVIPVFQLKREA